MSIADLRGEKKVVVGKVYNVRMTASPSTDKRYLELGFNQEYHLTSDESETLEVLQFMCSIGVMIVPEDDGKGVVVVTKKILTGETLTKSLE